MGKCKHYPQDPSSGEGFCSSCLQKKLNSVWRGESTRSDCGAAANPLRESAASGSFAERPDSSLHLKEAIAVVCSMASITIRTHSSEQAAQAKGRDITDGGMDFVLDSRYSDGATSFRQPVLHPSSDTIRGDHARSNVDGSAMKDWTKRRSKVSSLVSKKVVGMNAALADSKPGLNSFSSARSVGCRSLPLVDRIAKETALRVIKEVGDHLSEGDGAVLETDVKEQDPRITSFSPSLWQSKVRSRWGLKGLGSPMTVSNRIVPSKSVENLQKLIQVHLNPVREDSRFVCVGDVDRQKRTLQQASDLQLKGLLHESEFSDNIVIEGMPDRILKPEDMNQRLRTSYNTVLQWLQDLPIPETPLQNIGDRDYPYLPSSVVMEIRSNGAYPEALAKVGHLHEIAEEHELWDESSVEEVPTLNHLRDVNSFGKFLIRAAQRRPKQGLSRVASAR